MQRKAAVWALWACAIVGIVWMAFVFLSATPFRPRPTPPPTPIPTATALPPGSRYLYVLSEVPDRTANVLISGHVARFDLAMPGDPLSIGTGVFVDAAVSPDGSRLYVAAIDPSTLTTTQPLDYLTAYDARTGAQIWRTRIDNRMWYKGTGQSTLAVSPDGRTLYVYSFDHQARQVPIDRWLELVDTATGQVLPTTIDIDPIPGTLDCGVVASMRFSPSGHEMYLVCSFDVRFVNLDTRQVEQRLSLLEDRSNPRGSGGAVGTAFLAGSGKLLILTSTFGAATIDTSRRVIERWADLPIAGDRSLADDRTYPQSMALSADGSRLVVVDRLRDSSGNDAPGDLYVYDTADWREMKRFKLDRLLYTMIPTISPDGQAVYAVALNSENWFAGLLRDADTVVSVSLTDGRTSSLLSRSGEAIAGAFLGP